MQGNYMLTEVVEDSQEILKKLEETKNQRNELDFELKKLQLDKTINEEKRDNCLQAAPDEKARLKCEDSYKATAAEIDEQIEEVNRTLSDVNEKIALLEKELVGEEFLIPVDNVFMIDTSKNTDIIDENNKAVCLQYKEFNASYSLPNEQFAPRFVGCFIEVFNYLGTNEQLLTDVAESVIKAVKAPNSQPELKFRYSGVIVSKVIEPYFGN